MADAFDDGLRDIARIAVAEVLDNADEHLDDFLNGSRRSHTRDQAEASGIGFDLVPQILDFVQQGWLHAQSAASELAREHPHLVNIAEGAMGNALYAAILKALLRDAQAGDPAKDPSPEELARVASKIAAPLGDRAIEELARRDTSPR